MKLISPSSWHSDVRTICITEFLVYILWKFHTCSRYQAFLFTPTFHCPTHLAEAESLGDKAMSAIRQYTRSYRPFWCELSPCSESTKHRCYAHYHFYKLHPLLGKSYHCPITVTQIRADLRCQQSGATAKKEKAVDRLTLRQLSGL